jgi:pyruvate ferredoxin oxidoreductase alpha subunit
MRQMLDGNGAAAEALKLARVDVVSAYPITPQSPIAEKLSQYAADGTMNTRYIRIESEHSALSCAIGAQLTGVRAATATSSVGLALMHEVLGVASGCRVPIVMPVVNRALVSPWSLWCDHQDSMAERDTGWLQFYAENVQEVLDLLIMAYKVAEHEHVLLPAMVCLDGFFLSHSVQPVDVPEQKTVDEFLPKYKSKNLYLDPLNPMFINNLTAPEDFSEIRFQQKVAFDNALKEIPEVQEEFFTTFGRRLEMVEDYKSEDAEIVLVTMGSMSGTAKHVVNTMRKAGHRVGVIIASASVGYIDDLKKKTRKARDADGPSYLHIHTPCPTGWGFDPSLTIQVARTAVQTGAWVLMEIENSKRKPILNHKIEKLKPIEEYLKLQERFKHLTDLDIQQIQKEIYENIKKTAE